MKYIIRIIQVSTLLGGAEFMLMLLFGDLTESVKPVVLGAVLVSLIIFGLLDIIGRKLESKRNKVSSTLALIKTKGDYDDRIIWCISIFRKR